MKFSLITSSSRERPVPWGEPETSAWGNCSDTSYQFLDGWMRVDMCMLDCCICVCLCTVPVNYLFYMAYYFMSHLNIIVPHIWFYKSYLNAHEICLKIAKILVNSLNWNRSQSLSKTGSQKAVTGRIMLLHDMCTPGLRARTRDLRWQRKSTANMEERDHNVSAIFCIPWMGQCNILVHLREKEEGGGASSVT